MAARRGELEPTSTLSLSFPFNIWRISCPPHYRLLKIGILADAFGKVLNDALNNIKDATSVTKVLLQGVAKTTQSAASGVSTAVFGGFNQWEQGELKKLEGTLALLVMSWRATEKV